ncbi:MAG: acetolactate synthase small subunit [Calditrichaeota bacterium]|nr:acetolactate synthase small subunit [Calditrichota bacterium]
MKQPFTISVFTENHIGLLNRITIIFTRRHINIESITASESEVEGIHRFTIAVVENRELVEKVVKQIEKQVEVLKAFFNTEEEIFYQEIALYKIPTNALGNGVSMESLVREHRARVLSMEEEFVIIEKTGHKEETQALLEELRPLGVLEFVRSGRVAIRRPMHKITDAMLALEAVTEA